MCLLLRATTAELRRGLLLLLLWLPAHIGLLIATSALLLVLTTTTAIATCFGVGHEVNLLDSDFR